MRVLDGNVLAGTDHRLTALRQWLNACLPGKSLVVYEPGLGLVTDLVLCEDAYTQERALVTQLLPRVQANDLVVADRNFCTTRLVFGSSRQKAFVLVRQHRRNSAVPAGEPAEALWQDRHRGDLRAARAGHRSGDRRGPCPAAHRNPLVRQNPRRRPHHGLADQLAGRRVGRRIAELYLLRWTIEKHFQFLTQSLHCELPGLGQPRAALFGFAMALLAGNALAVVRASIRSVHGVLAEAEDLRLLLGRRNRSRLSHADEIPPARPVVGLARLAAVGHGAVAADDCPVCQPQGLDPEQAWTEEAAAEETGV